MKSKLKWSIIDSFEGNKKSEKNFFRRVCPVCESDQNQVITQYKNFLFYTDCSENSKLANITQVRYQNCGAIYQNPTYSNHGYQTLFRQAGKSYGADVSHLKEQITWLNKHSLFQSGNSLLDVGCYDGKFLRLIPKRIKKIGIDIDEVAIERARKLFDKSENVDLIYGSFEKMGCLSVKPDTITLFHVLEHLADPLSILKKLRSLSHEKTHLVIEIPILENGKTNDINGFFSIQHTTHFTKNSVINVLLRGGWNIIESEKVESYNGYRILAQPTYNDNEINQPLKKLGEKEICDDYLIHEKENIKKINKISQIPQKANIVLWGAGMHTEILYQSSNLFKKFADSKFIIVDNDELKQGLSWRGLPIYDTKILKTIDWIDTILLVSSYGSQDVIVEAASNYKVPGKRIFTLYNHLKRY